MPRYIIYAIFGINHTLRRRNQGVLESFFIIRHKNDIVCFIVHFDAVRRRNALVRGGGKWPQAILWEPAGMWSE